MRAELEKWQVTLCWENVIMRDDENQLFSFDCERKGTKLISDSMGPKMTSLTQVSTICYVGKPGHFAEWH